LGLICINLKKNLALEKIATWSSNILFLILKF